MKQLLLLLTLILLLPTHVTAQGPNRAGLVIQYGDGRIESACVSFSEPEISGFQLLQRSGLPMSYDAQSGTTVCSIRDEGCAFPSQSCFCQCETVGQCIYWSYHRLQPDGSWRYSQLGATASKVRPGEVDGWRWGAGESQDAPPPIGVSFESICATPPTNTPLPATATPAPPTATPLPPTATQEAASPTPGQTEIAVTVRASASATPAPSATRRATALPSATLTMLPPASATPLPSSTPASAAAAAPPSPNYLLFGLIALLLIGALGWARRR